jgi:hypothetical protein
MPDEAESLRLSAFGRPADLEIRDTAGLETCATLRVGEFIFGCCGVSQWFGSLTLIDRW